MDKVSVMIMSHDNKPLLTDCLNRIEGTMKEVPHEVVIVDDASTPPYTPEDFPMVKELVIVRMPRRSDCCNLRNVGMAMCKTDLVYWVDNDTMVDGEWWKILYNEMDKDVGLVGQAKDSRMVRNPFLPLTQRECMVEYQFAFDYNHLTGYCDWITTYCVLVRKAAYRPCHNYGMPTPTLDPELGMGVRANGYKVKVCTNLPVNHIGSNTPRPYGLNYLFLLSRKFTEWWNFWEHHKEMLELYSGKPVEYDYNANEPERNGSRGNLDEKDKDYEVIPEQFEYHES